MAASERLREIVRRAGGTLYVVTLVVLLAAIIGLTYLGHEVYEGATEGDGVGALDHPAQQVALDARAPWLTTLMVGLTLLGGRLGMPLLAVSSVLALVAVRRGWTAPLLVMCTAVGALVLTTVGKTFVGRVRPPTSLALPPFETSPSFPSGHTLNATALAAILAYLALVTARRRWVTVLVVVALALFALGVGLSRVYLGQHWLTDVFGGWTVGALWALGVITAHRVWLRHRGPVETEQKAKVPA